MWTACWTAIWSPLIHAYLVWRKTGKIAGRR